MVPGLWKIPILNALAGRTAGQASARGAVTTGLQLKARAINPSNLETARKVHDDLTAAGIYPQENDLNTAIQLLKRIHLIGPAPIPSELQMEVDMFLKKLTSS